MKYVNIRVFRKKVISLHKCLRFLATMMVTVALTGGLAVLPSTPAAASNWPTTVGNTGSDRPNTLMVHPENGRVTVCDYDYASDRGLLGLEPDGSQFLDLPRDPLRPDLCRGPFDGPFANIDASGVVYGVMTSSYDGDFVVAYDGQTEVWSTQLSSSCGTSIDHITGPMLAPDGSIYVVFDDCSRIFLSQLDSIDGSVIDMRELMRDQFAAGSLRQYIDGFVLKPGYGSEFHFYRFDDLSNPSTYEPSLESGENFTDFWEVNPVTGDLYLTTGADQACHSQGTISSVVHYDGQSQTRHDLESACLLWSSHLTVSPSGAVVAGAEPSYSTSPLDEGEAKVVLINENGVTTEVLPDPTAHKLWRPEEVRVDMHGNVLVARDYDIRPGNRSFRHVDFLLYDANGTLLKRFTTETLKRDEWHNFKDVVLANGGLYALIQHGENVGDYKVHQLPMALASFDYSRGTLLGVSSEQTEPLNYVAMGDSFSSGHEPYADGCRRNDTAYPQLLARDPQLPWVMQDFVACSGATTYNITHEGQHGEDPQLTAITSETDVATLTLGGNDVPFKDFVAACITPDEDLEYGCATSPKDDAITNINGDVSVDLENTFEAIESRRQLLQSSMSAYVIGYPQMVPESWADVEDVGCVWMTQAEHEAIKEVTDVLNARIEASVLAVDPNNDWLHFVSATEEDSPFIGHELCQLSSERYFRGLALDETTASIHPLPSGHDAYRRLMIDYLGL